MRPLTPEEHRELEVWRDPFRVGSSDLIPQWRGNQSLVAVSLPAGRDRKAPVSFEILIRGQ
jgi:hypothetical protein